MSDDDDNILSQGRKVSGESEDSGYSTSLAVIDDPTDDKASRQSSVDIATIQEDTCEGSRFAIPSSTSVTLSGRRGDKPGSIR